MHLTDRKANAMMRWVSVDCIFSTLVPRRQTIGHLGIFTSKIEDNVTVIIFQKHLTGGQCHNRCISVPTSPQPCQHECEREWSIFFNQNVTILPLLFHMGQHRWLDFAKIKMNHKSVTEGDTDEEEGKTGGGWREKPWWQHGEVQYDIWVCVATSWPWGVKQHDKANASRAFGLFVTQNEGRK